MKSLYTLGVAAGFAVLAAGFSIPTAVSAAPASPIAIKQALGEAPSSVIDVQQRWRGGGRHFGGGGTGAAATCGGGRHWGGGTALGWRPALEMAVAAGMAIAGMAADAGAAAAGMAAVGVGGAPIVIAPFAYNSGYYNDDCGYVSARRWVNGRRIWVRRYQCW